MTKCVIVNEILPDADAQAFLRLAKLKVPDCELQWGKMFDSYEVQTFLDPKVPYVPTGQDFVVYLTERNAKVGDAGYHDFVTNPDGSKYPVAWCSLKNSGSMYGKFHYPIVTLAHKVGLLNIPRRQIGIFKIWSHGLATVMLHEIMEALANPWLDKFSGTAPGTTLDSNGNAIFLEICDPVAHSWDLWTDPVTKQDIAAPSFVFQNWYNINTPVGTQVCSDNSVTKPFQKASGGYDFFKRLGKWVKA